jgi:hypothetical protein
MNIVTTEPVDAIVTPTDACTGEASRTRNDGLEKWVAGVKPVLEALFGPPLTPDELAEQRFIAEAVDTASHCVQMQATTRPRRACRPRQAHTAKRPLSDHEFLQLLTRPVVPGVLGGVRARKSTAHRPSLRQHGPRFHGGDRSVRWLWTERHSDLGAAPSVCHMLRPLQAPRLSPDANVSRHRL